MMKSMRGEQLKIMQNFPACFAISLIVSDLPVPVGPIAAPDFFN